MLARLLGLPFIVLLMGIGAVSMLPVSVHAYVVRDLPTARIFLYSSLMFLILFSMIAVATSNIAIRRQGRSHLIALVAAFTVLPLMLAFPFHEAIGNTAYLTAYVEMVSSFTTTGATLFEPDRLPSSLHLWRAQVGWMGGFLMWLVAVALFAPMNLGGYEVNAQAEIGQGALPASQITRVADISERLTKFALRLFPIYTALTAVLWLGLALAGDPPLVAICHAMSILATSGISPVGGLSGSSSGLLGEAVMLIFLVFALSRVTFSSWERPDGLRSLGTDPELRLGVIVILAVPLVLFIRHWTGSSAEGVSLGEGLTGLWGGVFTAASFLTTTGFRSAGWDEAQLWSGLPTPGLILMGLAIFGGGIATTAGGVKLFRVFALYKHGLREMEKLVLPSSVGGSGQTARRIRRQGAYAAWIFFMLFALSIAGVMTAFSLSGVDFEQSMVLTVAALSTTGPITDIAMENPIDLLALSPTAKLIFTAAMVIGRVEILAIIALMNPAFWRA
jgi:trk system potassium uptake protein TrkH